MKPTSQLEELWQWTAIVSSIVFLLLLLQKHTEAS
jgi:hypothetical protein